MLNKYYSTTEASAILGVSRITVFNWILKKKIKAKKYAGRFLIEESVIKNMIKPGYMTDKDKQMVVQFINTLTKDYAELLKSTV